MIPQHNGNKAGILSAYSDMLLNEAVGASAKKIHSAVVSFLNKNKADVKDMKKAMKTADSILKSGTDDVDWINSVATLGNYLKDSKKYEKDLEKILDMI